MTPAGGFGKKHRAQRETVLGLDLGRHAVKAVEIERRGEALTVTGCAYEAVGADADYPAMIRALLDAGNFAAQHVVVGLAGRGMHLAHVSLPKDRDYDQAVAEEAARILPYDPADACIDCRILDSEHLPQIRALFAAARRDDVLDRLDLLFAAGVHPMRLEPEAVALANAVAVANQGDFFLPEGSAAAVVDFGAGKTLIAVSDGVNHVFRDFPLGGDALTEMIAARTGCPLAKAEALKLAPGTAMDMVKDAVYPGIEDLAGEIRACIDRYAAAAEGRQVRTLLLSGGLVAFPGVVPLMGRMTGTAACVLKAFGGVDASGLDPEFLARHGHELTVAFGLACHAAD